MKIDELQEYVQDLLEAHDKFSAVPVTVALDDGSYPKIPEREAALREKGLCLTVWRVESLGLKTASLSGVFGQFIHLVVVIEENSKVNRADGGTKITAETALTYVQEAITGNPKGGAPNEPILPSETPFDHMGTVNGVRTIIVNFETTVKTNPYTPPA